MSEKKEGKEANPLDSLPQEEESAIDNEALSKSDDRKQRLKRYGPPLMDIEEGRRYTLGVSFPSKLLGQIIERADAKDIPRSQLITDAVRAYMKGATPERVEELESALKQSRETSDKSLAEANIRERTLIDNLHLVEALTENRYEGDYTCNGLGKHWQEILPIHPSVLSRIKEQLSERSGSYRNDYERFLELVAEAENLELKEMRKIIDSVIEADQVFFAEEPKKKPEGSKSDAPRRPPKSENNLTHDNEIANKRTEAKKKASKDHGLLGALGIG